MLTDKLQREFYQAMLDKNIEYEGVFYVGVLSTGIFCRPTCSARKPKFNCKFYRTAEEALLASFRPCMRCHPLSNPDNISWLVSTLIEAIELEPEKRWKNADLSEFSIDASTACRQFQKRFGMSFIEYARARRMGVAIKQIHAGETIIETQFITGYESSSGFRDAFSKIMGGSPTHKEMHRNVLQVSWMDTPLGPMIGISDKEHLYLLEFIQRRGLQHEIEQLCSKNKSVIVPGEPQPLVSIKEELQLYFSGQLKKFKTPLCIQGTEFQKTTWKALINIPYGQTRSYKEQAQIIEKPLACRAVANANASNQFVIIIPCHRIINSNGKLGGYAGGVPRKQWLLEHEQRHL